MTNLAKLKKFQPLIKQRSISKGIIHKQDISGEPIKEIYHKNYESSLKSDKNVFKFEEELKSDDQMSHQKIVSQIELCKETYSINEEKNKSYQDESFNSDTKLNDSYTISKRLYH